MDQQKNLIKAEAKRLGFSFIGFTEPRQTLHFNNYLEWIQQRKYAGMDYLAKPYVMQGRRQPESLLEGARTVIVAGIHYLPHIQLGEITSGNDFDRGWIAAYGSLADYHKTIKEMFRSLSKSINELVGTEVKSKIFIDSGPVMEKDFARQAGLGWIGKNSLLITPRFGSYCLLGCLFLDLELPPDSPLEEDICGECEICIQACPTHCINPDRTINAEQCISYQTIENQNEIPQGVGEKMGHWVFGCDICQIVCPMNRKLVEKKPLGSNPPQIPMISQKVDLSQIGTISANEFKERFFETPLACIGLEIFQRNVLNALKNQNNKDQIS
jgi:epoxyqueuosine reductase